MNRIRMLLALAALGLASMALVACTSGTQASNDDVTGSEPVNSTPANPDDVTTDPAGPTPARPAPSDPSQPAPGLVDPGDVGRKQVPAPIDAHDLLIRESAPPQYALQITSGLPSGCAAFDRLDVERDGTNIRVMVWNTMPDSDNVACTMIYGMMDHTVELGTDFEPGTEYTININGEVTLKFVAQ